MSESEKNSPPSSPRLPSPVEEARLGPERRVVVLSPAREALRRQYADACQVCARTVYLDGTQTYAEVHALLPPGAVEPDDPPREHCLVLCPEHHVLFDAGAMAIEPEDITLRCADPENPAQGQPLKRSIHVVPKDVLVSAWAARAIPDLPEEEEDEETLPPARHRSTDSLLEAIFAAALHRNEEKGFDRFMHVMAGSKHMAATGRRMHRQFSWAQLRRRVDEYVRDGDPTTYYISSMRPERIDANTDKVRIMLRSAGRNPAPIVAVRDEDEGYWWLQFCGL